MLQKMGLLEEAKGEEKEKRMIGNGLPESYHMCTELQTAHETVGQYWVGEND
jgi:hypothetical protein